MIRVSFVSVKICSSFSFKGLELWSVHKPFFVAFIHKFLKIKEDEQVEITEGRRLKLEKYYAQVLVASEIMNKETASDTNKLKAMQLQQEAMAAIPDKYFKEFSEIYE